MNVNRKLLVSFSGPFKDKQIIPLNKLDRINVAKAISVLNHKVRLGQLDGITEIFNFWFGKSTDEIDSIFTSISEYYQKIGYTSKQVAVLNLWSNFTLMDLLLSELPDQETAHDSHDFNTNLFLHYLQVNDQFISKSDSLANEIKSEDYSRIEDYIARFHVSNSINNFEITYTDVLHTLISNFYKSFLLLSFLESEYDNLLEVFLADYNVCSKEEFLKSIIPIAFHAINGEISDSGIQIMKVEGKESTIFLDQLIANSEATVKSLEDFVHLRANPLFKIAEDEYLIIDRGLAINRLFSSIFFDIFKTIKDKRVEIKRDFFGIYTYDFVEKYLSYTVLDKIFSKRNFKVFNGEYINSTYGVDTEPDYYVRNGKKILLFEIKGSIMRGDVKQSFSWSKIEEEVRKKFYGDAKNKKAVLQLVERIEILVEEKHQRGIYDKFRPDNFIVTPILIVVDHSLSTIGINHILNTWFQEEILKSKILSPIKHRIKKLVLINIDTLIVYSEYLKEKSGSFEAVLDSYIRRTDISNIDSIRKKYFPDGDIAQYELEQRINDVLIPFSKHIEEKIGKPKMIKEFLGFAEKLFK